MRHGLIVILLLALALPHAAWAQAIVTVEFSGIFDGGRFGPQGVRGEPVAGMALNGSFHGSFTYAAEAFATERGEHRAAYEGALRSCTLFVRTNNGEVRVEMDMLRGVQKTRELRRGGPVNGRPAEFVREVSLLQIVADDEPSPFEGRPATDSFITRAAAFREGVSIGLEFMSTKPGTLTSTALPVSLNLADFTSAELILTRNMDHTATGTIRTVSVLVEYGGEIVSAPPRRARACPAVPESGVQGIAQLEVGSAGLGIMFNAVSVCTRVANWTDRVGVRDASERCRTRHRRERAARVRIIHDGSPEHDPLRLS